MKYAFLIALLIIFVISGDVWTMGREEGSQRSCLSFIQLPEDIQFKIFANNDKEGSLLDYCKKIGRRRLVCRSFNTILSPEKIKAHYGLSGIKHSPGMKFCLLAEALRYKNNDLVTMAIQFGRPDFSKILKMTLPCMPDNLNAERANLILEAQVKEPSAYEQIILYAITGEESCLFELLDRYRKDNDSECEFMSFIRNASGKTFTDTAHFAIIMSSKHGNSDLACKIIEYLQKQKRPIDISHYFAGFAAESNRDFFDKLVTLAAEEQYVPGIKDCEAAIITAASHRNPKTLRAVLQYLDTLSEIPNKKYLFNHLILNAAIGGCGTCLNTAVGYLQSRNFAIDDCSVAMAHTICSVANDDIRGLDNQINILRNNDYTNHPLLDDFYKRVISIVCAKRSCIGIKIMEIFLGVWCSENDRKARIENSVITAMDCANDELVKYLIKYAEENRISLSVDKVIQASKKAKELAYVELIALLEKSASIKHVIPESLDRYNLLASFYQ